MRRIIKTDENGNIRIAGNPQKEIWMTAWEMSELFNVSVSAIQKGIRAIRKSGIYTDYEVCKYIRMENGYSADIFSIDIIIAVSYRLNTFYAYSFREWLKRKVLCGNPQKNSTVFFLIDKGYSC
ncbi:RhuM protein [Phocaeicola sartorii]|uniref:RhuM protein n=1 Tax=Phocaeicola sartorii TaxID=671267 RepID=UPI0025A9E19F|nr:RhuM protein [Phocaeicola sartorii]